MTGFLDLATGAKMDAIRSRIITLAMRDDSGLGEEIVKRILARIASPE